MTIWYEERYTLRRPGPHPQNRVTDHRLEGEDKNHALESVMEGHLDPIIRALRTAEHAEHLAKLG
jgi:peptide chain release factor 1